AMPSEAGPLREELQAAREGQLHRRHQRDFLNDGERKLTDEPQAALSLFLQVLGLSAKTPEAGRARAYASRLIDQEAHDRLDKLQARWQSVALPEDCEQVVKEATVVIETNYHA